MFKKLSILLIVFLFSSNAFAFCIFGFGDCGGKNFFLIDKNVTYVDQNITGGTTIGGFYFPGLNLSLTDGNFFNVDLNGYLIATDLWSSDFNSNWLDLFTGKNISLLNNDAGYITSGSSYGDVNVNEIIASRMPITDANLSIPGVWAAIDGNASSGSGSFYYAGSNMTLSDSNYFNADLNGVMTETTFDSNFNASTYGSSDFNSIYLNTVSGVTRITAGTHMDINSSTGDVNISIDVASLELESDKVYNRIDDSNNSARLDSGVIANPPWVTSSLTWSELNAVVPWDWDVNVGNKPWWVLSNSDSNAQTVCTGLEYLAGNGTCQTVSATGGEIGTFKGLTSTAMDGDISFDGNTGYVAANNMCDGNYAGTHWCSTDEIKASINDNNYISFPNAETAWTAEFAPGYLVNANDCVGMTSNTLTYLGAFWIFDTTRGGDAWLTNCANKKKLACCK